MGSINPPPKNIALLGGSFDPPHLAHVQVAEYLLKSGRFEEIWIVPGRQNPLKPAHSPFSDRLEMCRVAFADLGNQVKVLTDDAQLSGYTVDLARHLHQKFPQSHFTFVAGSDLKDEIGRWKEPEELKKLLTFEFLPRPPDADSPFAPIRASEIREKIKKGLPIENLVPKSVEAYIRQHRLYL